MITGGSTVEFIRCQALLGAGQAQYCSCLANIARLDCPSVLSLLASEGCDLRKTFAVKTMLVTFMPSEPVLINDILFYTDYIDNSTLSMVPWCL
jgi:hypothetical protein